ncbi:hypothetical protein GDO86_002366 [Hymenochirus boettgeri]|uniref:Shieldin complex subunit 3 n=1 Tax=Hymenochirus boettgeri TaxID=247094 RepID=A0A8T2KGL5_9PIPI|nr:hypothetical protein GDO86_002366 [Hymenochirus boettgeri]
MEVLVHYRPHSRQEELQRMVAASLEDFPTRPLPAFVPWFPYHNKSFALKPARSAPSVSREDILSCGQCSLENERQTSVNSYDSTINLLEFHTNKTNMEIVSRTKMLLAEQEKAQNCLTKMAPSIGNPKLKRSWSICTLRGNSLHEIPQISLQLKNTLELIKLHPFHRGKWIIPSSVCFPDLETVWENLSSVMRHNVLPNCNATMQRGIDEIWVFCDLLYCEYTGQLLKTKLKLDGRIELTVRKHGILLSL